MLVQLPRLATSRSKSWLVVLCCAVSIGAAGNRTFAEPRLEQLEQRVTLRIADKPLARCLSLVSQQTGVSMRTGSGYEDRAVTIRVRNLPVRTFMSSVAALYGDFWRRETRGGRTVFVLEASLARRNRQSALLPLHEQVGREALLQRCRDILQNGVPEGLTAPIQMDAWPATFGLEPRYFSHCRPRLWIGCSRVTPCATP